MLCPHCSTVCCISDSGQTDFKISCHACKKTFPQFPDKEKKVHGRKWGVRVPGAGHGSQGDPKSAFQGSVNKHER